VERILVVCIALACVVGAGCAGVDDDPAVQSPSSSTTTSLDASPDAALELQPTFEHLGVTVRVDFVGALAAHADDGSWGCTRRLEMPAAPQVDQCVVIGFSFDVDERSVSDGELVQGDFVDSDGEVQTSDAVDVAQPGTTNNTVRAAYALTTSDGGTVHFSVGRGQDRREFELIVTPEMLGHT
jgi:hypothetical protein